MGYLEEIRQRGREANPFLCLMGIELNSFGNGKAILTMQVRPEMHNGAGWLQGGLLAAISDEAMALALFTVLEEGESIATISESTSFLKGTRTGKIISSGKVIKKGRNVAFMEGYVKRSHDDALLSETRASFAIIKPK